MKNIIGLVFFLLVFVFSITSYGATVSGRNNGVDYDVVWFSDYAATPSFTYDDSGSTTFSDGSIYALGAKDIVIAYKVGTHTAGSSTIRISAIIGSIGTSSTDSIVIYDKIVEGTGTGSIVIAEPNISILNIGVIEDAAGTTTFNFIRGAFDREID